MAQHSFAALGALRSLHVVRQPARLAGALHRLAPMLDRFGSALGGMVVRAQGRNAADRPLQREWHIAADNDHGPEIPCMAAILLARRLARGESLAPGAMPCMGLLTLEDFRPEFVRWDMRTDVLESTPELIA